MEKNQTDRKKRFTVIFVCASILMMLPMQLRAAERIYTAYSIHYF